jgi:hypothetical protein
LRGGGIFGFLFRSFDEFDVRHMQQELPGALAFRGQKPVQQQCRVQLRSGEQPRLGVERYAADFRLDLPEASRFGLLRLVAQPEFQRGNAGRRVA